MNPRTLLWLMPFIDEGIHTSADLAERSGLGERLVEEMLRQLTANGIGRLEDRSVTFSRRDRIAAAVLAVQMGCGVDEASRQIGWRDFEEIVSEIVSAAGYTVKRSLRLRTPRLEIDVLASKMSVGLAIDCKHWRRTVGASTMEKVADRQAERAKRLAASRESGVPRFRHLYPVVATLYEEKVRTVNGVPIVPVARLTGFLREFEGYAGFLKDACRP